MSQNKTTKSERREKERAKQKRKQQSGATLAGQMKRTQTNKQYGYKKESN